MSKLVLIDGNAILHRAYHAIPMLTGNAGQPTNAVHGFVSIMLRIILDLEPTHIVVAWDTAKPTFRHAQYSNYQANRPRGDSELISQFQLIYDVLKAMDIPIFFMEGFEADDILGTISSQVTLHRLLFTETIIVTGDRDILQLVDDQKNIKVFMPVKGLSEGKLYSDKDVVERMGVHANQIVDFKALVGDPSDNYPGVAGIGPKTAIGLLEKYQTLENIYKHLDEIKPTIAKKLATGAEPAGISQRLATIVRDVPVTFNLEDARKWDIANKKVIALFHEIGFKTLTARVIKVGAELEKKRQLSLV